MAREALRFRCALADVKGVRRIVEVRSDQTLADLHSAIQDGFGWDDDHLYSFWLDGRFWGDRGTQYTAPMELDDGVATADVPIARLDLRPGAKLAYVFDFGDEWRVRITLVSSAPADDGPYPRLVEAVGEAPPQYPDLEDEDDE